MDNSKLHIAIVASPGLGHLTPVMLLANRLATHHHITVTIIAVTTQLSPAESQILHHSNIKKLLNIIEIPHVDISGLIDADTKVVTQLCVMMRETRSRIRSAIAAMNHRPDALIVDIFGKELQPIADEFCMPKYVFVTTTAWFVALTTYCQVLDKEIKGEYVDQKEALEIPGCRSVRPDDVVDPMLDRNNQQYKEYVRLGIEFTMFDGILMNTWEDLELTTVNALRENEILRSLVKVPVYPVGPLISPVKPIGSKSELIEPIGSKSELIEWLDMQGSESVIYVSFGSGGTLSAKQITELAWALELSQQRFIWVVRPPMDSRADGTFFTAGNSSDGSPEYLPEGFVTRTHKLGKVVPLWAPQMEILSHPSVGGFLTHCGWNSTLESISNGVAMIAWPLYSEQRLNAALLTEELGVAVGLEVVPTKEIVDRKEIEKMVRSVMQYKEMKGMKERVKELKCSGEKALREGGSSYDNMCKVIKDIERRLQSSKFMQA